MKKTAVLMLALAVCVLPLFVSCSKPAVMTDPGPQETTPPTTKDPLFAEPEVRFFPNWKDVYFEYEWTRGEETVRERIEFYRGDYPEQYGCDSVIMVQTLGDPLQRYYFVKQETFRLDWSREELDDLYDYESGEEPSEEETAETVERARSAIALLVMEDPYYASVRYRKTPSEDGRLSYDLIGAGGEKTGAVELDAGTGSLVRLERENEILTILSSQCALWKTDAETVN